jgi:hypothetical protein
MPPDTGDGFRSRCRVIKNVRVFAAEILNLLRSPALPIPIMSIDRAELLALHVSAFTPASSAPAASRAARGHPLRNAQFSEPRPTGYSAGTAQPHRQINVKAKPEVAEHFISSFGADRLLYGETLA